MNKKQLSEYAQTIAVKIAEDNKIDLTEAQVLVGLALKKLTPEIVKLATPRVGETVAS